MPNPGEAKLEQTALGRAIFVESLADVQVERVALVVQIGDEQILVAVTVDVAEIDAHASLGLSHPVDRHAGQQRLVAERARSALVDPELIRVAVVGDVDVEPAIVVVVGGEHAESAAPRPG